MSDQAAQSPEDVDALKARIAELEAQKPKRRFDGRGFTAWVVVIIAALLFPIALTAFWGQRTLTDTERYVATVAPLAEDPTVREAIGDKVTTVIVTQLDAQVRISNLLADYPKLQPIAGPLASGVNSFVGTEVDKLLASDRFSQIWVDVNTKLQQGLIAALSDDPTGPITIQGDQVILDTGDLIEEVKQRLVDRGLTIAANIPVPPIADRQIVLLTSPQLQTARTAYALGQPVAQWLIYVVLLLFVVAILVSRRRARMTIAVGVAILIGAIVIRLGMAVGQNQLAMTLDGTPFEVAQTRSSRSSPPTCSPRCAQRSRWGSCWPSSAGSSRAPTPRSRPGASSAAWSPARARRPPTPRSRRWARGSSARWCSGAR